MTSPSRPDEISTIKPNAARVSIMCSIVQEEDWRARESAILALGAISEGCAKGLLPFLAEMLGMLLPKLGDARPLVRSITCWALSRYSHWLVQAAEQAIPLAKDQLHSVLKVTCSTLFFIESLSTCHSPTSGECHHRVCMPLPQKPASCLQSVPFIVS